MSDENNNKDSEQKENIFQKGWTDLSSTFTSGFQKFKKNLEDQAQKSTDNWEKSKEKADKFFNKIHTRRKECGKTG